MAGFGVLDALVALALLFAIEARAGGAARGRAGALGRFLLRAPARPRSSPMR